MDAGGVSSTSASGAENAGHCWYDFTTKIHSSVTTTIPVTHLRNTFDGVSQALTHEVFYFRQWRKCTYTKNSFTRLSDHQGVTWGGEASRGAGVCELRVGVWWWGCGWKEVSDKAQSWVVFTSVNWRDIDAKTCGFLQNVAALQRKQTEE